MTRHPQTIDAECGICMEPYVEVREDTDGVDSSITSQRGLVWCKAQCGGNLHKACFSRWEAQCLRGGLGQSRCVVTCPLCRAEWKDEEQGVEEERVR
ncbi:hypothetical protein BDBG_09117 [Blastomyces gilchristii SLH14081]|uniref:RING-type domain-containing protein n=1 Tax=Blastomyces gilchristii (strain SLH14081) TaxID=559298 RepID=A0A179V114_BLAGS|nr:uncharacterized protein BDBG_09117 [Blastomyces gilchristii SLH14081]OAT14024.1 hypothetical protein BDBG_09117 [Blastomyces gilchristii SLH14081]